MTKRLIWAILCSFIAAPMMIFAVDEEDDGIALERAAVACYQKLQLQEREVYACHEHGSPEYFEVVATSSRHDSSVGIRKTTSKSRSFRFRKDGLFWAFVWNADDDRTKTDANSSGMRSFWMFPIVETKPLITEDIDFFYVTTHAGVNLKITKITGQIAYTDRADFRFYREIPKITAQCDAKKNPASCGGVEILRVKFGLVWDLGWAKGRASFGNKNAVSTLIDKHGNRCRIKNSELLDYKAGEASLRFKTNQELAVHLAQLKSCQKLDVADLLDTSQPIEPSPPIGPSTFEIDAITGAGVIVDTSTKPVPTPAPTPSPEPLPESTPEPSAEPTPIPEPSPEPISEAEAGTGTETGTETAPGASSSPAPISAPEPIPSPQPCPKPSTTPKSEPQPQDPYQ